MGPDPKFGPEYESQLVVYIEFMTNIGSLVSVQWVKKLLQDL